MFFVLTITEERAMLVQRRSDILEWMADPRQACRRVYADRVRELRHLQERLDWLAQIGD